MKCFNQLPKVVKEGKLALLNDHILSYTTLEKRNILKSTYGIVKKPIGTVHTHTHKFTSKSTLLLDNWILIMVKPYVYMLFCHHV